MAGWTGDQYAEQCNLYTCQANYIAVGNDAGDRCTGANSNICKRGARCVAPSSVAPNSVAKFSCAGLQTFVTSGGLNVTSATYRMLIKKAGTVVYDSGSTYLPLSTTADELSGFNV